VAGKLKDLVGQAFGRLTVLRFAEYKTRGTGRRYALWRCRCACGKRVTVSSIYLKTSTNASCGCAQRARKSPPGRTGMLALMATYKQSAQMRGVPFVLTEDQFKVLTTGACRYCGNPPSQLRVPNTVANTDWSEYATYLYNGIDRIDSNRGYEPGNCASACGTCNIMKSDLPLPVFAQHVLKIAAHLLVTRFFGNS
jgi:hypothetical protein